MTEAPYGLGPFALALFMACAVRHFGDELRLKINPTALGYAPTNDPETIIDLATGKFPTATVERRFLNAPTAHLINEIYNLFAETPAPAGTQQTLSEAWRALQGWWKARTRLERKALEQLDWLVVQELFQTETVAFWRAPGVNPAEVKVDVNGPWILVTRDRSAESRQQETFDDGRGYRRSFSYSSGRASRRFTVPRDGDTSAMQRQDLEDAIRITIPRTQAFAAPR